ncbi:MAG: hypothetical protein Kow0075_00900 [Salibacteraceae bacterium]
MISSNKHYIEGRRRFEQGDYEAALDLYNKAIAEEENPNLYSERAVVYFYLGKRELSLRDMNHAADLDPENPYRYSSRAYIKDWIGDVHGAIADYEMAIKLDPEDSVAYNNLGLLQEKLGYMAQAQENFKRADRLAGVDELLEKIRREHLDKPACTNEDQGVQVTYEEISVAQLLKKTFTTKSGFREFVKFITNGFKL